MARTMSTSFMKVLVVTAAAAVTMFTSASADTPSPFVGKWALDLERSTFTPGPSGLKSQTVTISGTPGATLNVIDTVAADGSTYHVTYTSANDGKSVPTTGDPDSDSVVITSLNPNSAKVVYLKAGKATAAGRLTVSKSGKTLRGPFHGTNADGSKWKNHLVYVRQ